MNVSSLKSNSNLRSASTLLRQAVWAGVFFLLSFSTIKAATVTSVSSGKWSDPSNWDTGTVPTATDDVVIAATHLLQLEIKHFATFFDCNSLEINTLGGLVLLQSNFTVHGTTTLNGGFLLDSDPVGVNRFKGHVTVGTGGVFNISSVTNVSRNVFEGGFTHNGSSFSIEGCTFEANNQTIGGSSPFAFTLRANIADGITVTNISTVGLTIESSSRLAGLGATATFENQGLVFYQSNTPPMEAAILDVDAVGNTMVFNRDAFLQEVPGATYYNLIIGTDPAESNFFRRAIGDIIVLNDLTIENAVNFEPEGNNLEVQGQVLLTGTLRDDVAAGTNTLNEIVFTGGTIGGNGSNFGVSNINKLNLKQGSGSIGEGVITVSDSTNIATGFTLAIASNQGTKTFDVVEVAAGGLFNVATNLTTTNLVFDDMVNNAGTMFFQKGTHTFNGKLTNTGTWTSSETGALFTFAGDLQNDGTFTTAFADYEFGGTLMGTNSLTLNGAVTVLAGQTMVNQLNELTMDATLDGADGTATFENQAILNYNPTSNALPMVTGNLDVDFAGNTFNYKRTAGVQAIQGGTYHNLSFQTAGGVTLNDGEVQVQGSLANTGSQTGTNIIRMTGGNTQAMYGSGSYETLIVDKSAGTINVLANFTVNDALTFIGGVMETAANKVTLGSTGTLTETPTAFLKGNIETTRNVPVSSSETFGGMGLTLITAPGKSLSTTTVIRNNTNSLTSGFLTRSFDITPTNNVDRNATIVFTYADDDLAGVTESNLRLYESVSGGAPVDMGGTLDVLANTITLSGVNSFDTWTAGDPAAFPVELVSFEATPEYQDVVLTWTTATELNNDRFEIERSFDGEQFAPLGSVSGSGTTASTQHYQFRDLQALEVDADVLFYRLKQIDLDGSAHLSNVVAVSILKTESLGLSAFPVPFQDQLTVRISLETASPLRVQLLNVQGKVLSEERLDGQRGINPYQINGEELSSGVYLVRVITAQTSTFVRVVKE